MLFAVFIIFGVILQNEEGIAEKRNLDSFPFCGWRFRKSAQSRHFSWSTLMKNYEYNKRIVGGKESKQGSWPWQVALFYNGTQLCGGSLVNHNWIVTASHCFHETYSSTDPKMWTATLGEHKLKKEESFEQIRDIERIILHPKYKSMLFEGIFDTPPDYDIALVRLKEPAIMDENVYPICLLRPHTKFHWGKVCYISGWGHTKFNGTQPEALNEAQLKLVSTNTCNKKLSYSGKIHGRALCAGFEKGGVDSCQFDSGGPLSCAVNGQYFLTGVVSWGHKCASPHKYGVYSNMMVMTPWVFEKMRNIDGI
ncbi:transmembrane protease serine 2-like [Actinia tenebrosa]|uniref:Transmembrane protease serine 2-like n=1 Tax=Actinia tenebrosa TaxID=6105 RepID=A0A6P8H934_ACTTE|nr:transmembrane protease serine 2-like [Actinia tenebrosa]